MIRPFAALLFLSLVAIGCTSSRYEGARAPAGFVAQDDRKVVRTGDLQLAVGSLEKSRAEVERIVAEAAGLVESTNTVEEERVALDCRVPSEKLEAVMDQLAALGDVTRRSLSKADVTDNYYDLETRLKNTIALRDRLRALLDRANGVNEVITVERELTRVQTEAETLQGQFDRLRGQVSRSTLTVTLERRQILGPLGWIGYGVWWAVRKLFVID